MAWRKTIGQFVIYLPLIGLLALAIYSLCIGATTSDDGIERDIRIWKDALILSAIIGEIGSLIVVRQFNILLTGTTPNFIQDLQEENSQDFAIIYNGIVACAVFVFVLLILKLLYSCTQIHLFSKLSTIFVSFWAISNVVYLLAGYLRIRQTQPQSLFSKFSNPALMPTILSMIQILITRQSWVSFVYRNIYAPQSERILTLALVIVILYFLAAAFCHFSDIYCLLGFWFLIHGPETIQKKMDLVLQQEEYQEEKLRYSTENLDKEVKQSSFVKRVLVCTHYIGVHLKIYVQKRICAVKYMMMLLNFKMTKLFGSLLKPSRIRLNTIRFCLLGAMMELLVVDFLLFIYLKSDSPCLKFFELMSTVFIIPILLSWLMELKSNAKKENKPSQE